MKKKLLVYAHYYYPDVASTGQILAELCEGLLEDFEITVICVVPSYTGKIVEKYKKQKFYFEEHNGVKIVRVRVPEFDKTNKLSRIKNITSYFINSVLATFKVGKQDLVYSISQPPILGGILGVIGKLIKRAKYVYNIQDFNPEQVEVVGFSKSPMIIKLAKAFDKFSCKCSDCVIVVGRDMQQTLERRFKGKKVPSNVVINNWINEEEIYPLESEHERVQQFKEQYGLQDKFVMMYSGNIGLYYDLENIIKVIGEFKHHENIVFAFVGDGTVKNQIEEYSIKNQLSNVTFIPYQKKEDLIYSLNAADVHLVTNQKGIKGVSVPSKVYGVMATGKAILGVLEKGSEAELLISNSQCGLTVEPQDYDEIKRAIESLLQQKQEIAQIGIRGRAYLDQYLKKEISVNKYAETLKSLA